jgi:hypothetical protein
VWDRINDRHDTGARAMEAHDPTATHHLVIQDDVWPCLDVVAGAERALAWVPAGHPVSLYLGRVQPFAQQVQRAADRAGEGSSWITMTEVYWGPGIIVPVGDIAPMLEWYRSPKGQKVTNYDRRVGHWFKATGRAAWYTWPSLVEHRGDESLVRAKKTKRTAHRFLGENRSALSVDWSGEVVAMGNTRRLDEQRQRAAARA